MDNLTLDVGLADILRHLENLPEDLIHTQGRFSGVQGRFKYTLEPNSCDLNVQIECLHSSKKVIRQIRVGYTSQLSPWALFEQLSDRLKQQSAEDPDVYVGDIVSRLPLTRTTELIPIDQGQVHIDGKHQAAFNFLAQKSGRGATLRLTLTEPYELWAAGFGQDRPLWSGYVLPSAFSSLTPVMTVDGEDDRYYIYPLEIVFDDGLSVIDELRAGGKISGSEQEELSDFASVIRTSCDARRAKYKDMVMPVAW